MESRKKEKNDKVQLLFKCRVYLTREAEEKLHRAMQVEAKVHNILLDAEGLESWREISCLLQSSSGGEQPLKACTKSFLEEAENHHRECEDASFVRTGSSNMENLILKLSKTINRRLVCFDKKDCGFS
ncbi:MAG: hypothetical protein JHC28_05835 [Thermoprotei archaeon]|nr:hypothetical protein [Thermoprotei archaeon]